MVPDSGANSGLAARDLPAAEFRAGRHLHLSGYTLLNPHSRVAGIAALDLARRAGMTTSVDPSSAGPLTAIGPEAFLEWIDGADLLLANRDEACVLTGRADPGEAAGRLAKRFGEVVVKLGEDGALRHSAGASIRVPAYPATMSDTTGAGDLFAAGFIYGITNGLTPEESAMLGGVCAAEVIAHVGARPQADLRALAVAAGLFQ